MVLARSFDSRFADRSALSYLPSLLRFPALVWANRYMVQNFLRRDLMSRVNGSLLGVGWLLLRPMALFALYYLVFGVVLGPKLANGNPDPAYALYLFSGVIAFHALAEATGVACSVVVDNGNLVKKVAFPSEVLMVHVALVAQVIYAVGAVVLFVAGWSMGLLQPGWLLLALPVTMFLQFVLSLGIGMLLANLNVFSRDTAQLWALLSQAWMFLSPVFLHPTQLAAVAKEGSLLPAWGPGLVETLNPAWALMQAQRLSFGAVDPLLGPFWPQLGVASAWAFGFLVLGYTVFMSRKHKFADLI
jgi:lipopolysaccharide transport system permease protein